MSLSNTILRVTLPSGAQALYEVEPQHLNERPNSTLNERAISFGRQLAVENAGCWYDRAHGNSSWSSPIADPKAIAAIEAITTANQQEFA